MIKLTKLKFVDLQYVRQRLLLKCSSSSKPQYNYEQRLLNLCEDPLKLTFNHLRGMEESEDKPFLPEPSAITASVMSTQVTTVENLLKHQDKDIQKPTPAGKVVEEVKQESQKSNTLADVGETL